MEELTEVITAAEFHPNQCNTFVYSSSKGTIRLCDMRASALCDKHAKCKPDLISEAPYTCVRWQVLRKVVSNASISYLDCCKGRGTSMANFPAGSKYTLSWGEETKHLNTCVSSVVLWKQKVVRETWKMSLHSDWSFMRKICLYVHRSLKKWRKIQPLVSIGVYLSLPVLYPLFKAESSKTATSLW